MTSKNWNYNSIATSEYLRDYVGVDKEITDPVIKAAKEFAVRSCADNIEAHKSCLENHCYIGNPHKMRDMYDQAIYTEAGFKAGARWAVEFILSGLEPEMREKFLSCNKTQD
jgi:hypothetical protein